MDIIFDDYFKNGAFMSSIFGNIYYSKNIKFKIDDNIEYLNIITNEMKDLYSMSLRKKFYECNTVDEMAKLLKKDRKKFIEILNSTISFGDFFIYENKIMVDCTGKNEIKNSLKKFFPDIKFIFEENDMKFEINKFFIGYESISMIEIFNELGIDYKNFVEEIFEKNGIKKPEMIFYCDDYSFLNKDTAFIFMVIAEEELKNKINEYIIIETLNGGKI